MEAAQPFLRVSACTHPGQVSAVPEAQATFALTDASVSWEARLPLSSKGQPYTQATTDHTMNNWASHMSCWTQPRTRQPASASAALFAVLQKEGPAFLGCWGIQCTVLPHISLSTWGLSPVPSGNLVRDDCPPLPKL